MIYLNQNVVTSAKFKERQTAFVVTAESLLSGRYEKGKEEFSPNYMILQDGRSVSRVNMIAVIVSITEDPTFRSFTIDDGTARISARVFDKESFQEVSIGDVVLVVGRPRQFGTETYIVPEIMKKVSNPLWVEHRKLQLAKLNKVKKENKEHGKVEEVVIADENKEGKNTENIIETIKKLDKGEGAFIEDVVQGIKDGENIIKNLLEQGEIFEIKPGRIKVLE